MSEQRGETKPRREPRADSWRSEQRGHREDRREHPALRQPARREHSRSATSASIFDRVGRSAGMLVDSKDVTCVIGFVTVGGHPPQPQAEALTNHDVLGQLLGS